MWCLRYKNTFQRATTYCQLRAHGGGAVQKTRTSGFMVADSSTETSVHHVLWRRQWCNMVLSRINLSIVRKLPRIRPVFRRRANGSPDLIILDPTLPAGGFDMRCEEDRSSTLLAGTQFHCYPTTAITQADIDAGVVAGDVT